MEATHGRIRTDEDFASERAFGPRQDFRCVCGRRASFDDVFMVCVECGVEVLPSATRQHRFGHLELASAVPHPRALAWMASLFGLGCEDVLRVCRKEDWIVLDPKDLDLNDGGDRAVGQGALVTANRFSSIAAVSNENGFKPDRAMGMRDASLEELSLLGTGPGAFLQLLREIDLDYLEERLKLGPPAPDRLAAIVVLRQENEARKGRAGGPYARST